jgi:hypothetical protein
VIRLRLLWLPGIRFDINSVRAIGAASIFRFNSSATVIRLALLLNVHEKKRQRQTLGSLFEAVSARSLHAK